jgi:hypothetical protein
MAKANPFTRVRNLAGTARSAHPDKLRQKMNKGVLLQAGFPQLSAGAGALRTTRVESG